MEEEKKVKGKISTAIYHIASLAIVVAVMLLKVATIDGTFNINWGAFGIEAAIIWIAQYILFIVNYSIGKDKGRLTDNYIEAQRACLEKCKKLAEECMPEEIQAYCDYITNMDLQNAQRRALAGVCRYEDFVEKYQYMNRAQIKAVPSTLSESTNLITISHARAIRVKDFFHRDKSAFLFDRQQIRAIMKAKRMKAEKMTSSELIFADTEIDSMHRVIARPKTQEARQKTRKFLSSAIFAAVFTCVTISASVDFTFASVVDMFLSLVPIIIGLVTGRLQGYTNATSAAVAYFHSIAAEATSAYKWIKGEKTEK